MMLNVGFYQWLSVDRIVAILDYRTAVSQKLIKIAKEEDSDKILNCTRGKRYQSLIVMDTGHYVISTIPRKQLARRLGVFDTEPDTEKPVKGNTKAQGRPSNSDIKVDG